MQDTKVLGESLLVLATGYLNTWNQIAIRSESTSSHKLQTGLLSIRRHRDCSFMTLRSISNKAHHEYM